MTKKKETPHNPNQGIYVGYAKDIFIGLTTYIRVAEGDKAKETMKLAIKLVKQAEEAFK